MDDEEGACWRMDPYYFDIEQHGHGVTSKLCRGCKTCRLAVRACMDCPISMECLAKAMKERPEGMIQAGTAFTRGRPHRLTV